MSQATLRVSMWRFSGWINDSIGDLVKEAVVSEELLEPAPATLHGETVEGEAPVSA